MVLYVFDIDNLGERDVVEIFLVMWNFLWINYRDNVLNLFEEDCLYFFYFWVFLVWGLWFYRGDEVLFLFLDYFKMRRFFKFVRVGIWVVIFIIWNISLLKICFCIYKGCVIICNFFYMNIFEFFYCNRLWNFSEFFVCIFIVFIWWFWWFWLGDVEM